ncbi:MAG: cytochrome C biogenesis protein, partial [Nitrospinota bacterium]
LLPILLFPLTVPIVLGAVKTTGTILSGSSLTDGKPWLQMMGVFDLIFLVAAFLTFEFVVEE